MNVLHLTNDYPYKPLYGHLIQHLRKAGVSCEVFVPETVGLNKKVNDPGVVVDECYSRLERLVFSVKEKKTAEAVRRHYDLRKFDLIHAHRLFATGYAAYMLSRESGVPYVVAVRNTDVNLFLKYLWFMRKPALQIMRGAERIIFLSKPYLDSVIDTYVPRDEQAAFRAKSVVVPNGIDDYYLENRNEPKSLSRDTVHVLYVGEVNQNKNIRNTAAAIEQLNAQGTAVDYTIAGPVTDKRLESFLKGKSDLHYLPPCGKEEVLTLMRQADIFVMPSFLETFGLVYPEAMTQGLPLIYSKGQGFDGQFEDGYVGYAVAPKESASIAEGIRKCIEHYDVLSRHCTEACLRYSWDRIAKVYREIYESCVDEKKETEEKCRESDHQCG